VTFRRWWSRGTDGKEQFSLTPGSLSPGSPWEPATSLSSSEILSTLVSFLCRSSSRNLVNRVSDQRLLQDPDGVLSTYSYIFSMLINSM
jgi:hypothetical protein